MSSRVPASRARRRHVEQRDRAVGADDCEIPVGEDDVGVRRFQRLRRDALALVDDRVGGAPDRRAAHIGGARAAMAAAHRDQVGIALPQPDQRVGNAEPVGEDLRKRRLVALADGLRAGDQRHAAVDLEADIDVFVRRAAGALDVVGEAEAAQHAARLAVGAPRGEAGDIGPRQRAIERRREIAAVHREAERVGHRHRRRGHKVAAAQVGAVEAALPRRRVDQPLDDVDRFGKAGTAGDADRRGIGQHRSGRAARSPEWRRPCLADAHIGWSARRRRRPPCRRRDWQCWRRAAPGTFPPHRAPAPPRPR